MANKTIALMTGASNHTEEEREENDYYATEPLALEKFLDTIDFNLHTTRKVVRQIGLF